MLFFNSVKEKRGRHGCPLFFRLINALRCIFFFVFPLIPSLRVRLAFERQNRQDEACRSFVDGGVVADCAFEVSSEGELEQIHPLIDWILQRGGRVEILFASPSVEKKCRGLYESYRERVRILRMPLLTFFPWGFFGGQNIGCWLTAPILILCRYDFYPELFLYGAREGVEFCLVAASLKNKNRLRIRPYRCFDKIVCSSEVEEQEFLDRGWSQECLAVCEFRSVRILSRLKSCKELLTPWESFTSWIKIFSERDRLIVGNAWPEEMKVLEKTSLQKKVKEGKFLIVVVPHKTGTVFVNNLEEQVEGLSSYTLSRPEQWEDVLARWKQCPGVLFFNVSGVLLELYTLFRYAVVGGGHGKGVHSLLEPYWAGCSVCCGPKVERSSEYDFLKGYSPTRVQVVEDWKELPETMDMEENTVQESYSENFERVASWLLEDVEC